MGMKFHAIGRYITSNTFALGGYEWAIYFYPDGKSAQNSFPYVSAFIALASEGTKVRAIFELSLVDQNGKGEHNTFHIHSGPRWREGLTLLSIEEACGVTDRSANGLHLKNPITSKMIAWY